MAIDECVKATVEAAKAAGYEAIIIAEDGTPNTAHSLNPVPCIYVTERRDATVSPGRLADVAPSILHIMGLPQPEAMTGNNLLS